MIVTLPPRRLGEPDARVDLAAFPADAAETLRRMAHTYAGIGTAELVAVAADNESAYLRDRLWALIHQLDAKPLDRVELELRNIGVWFSQRVGAVDEMAAEAADAYWKSAA